MSETLSGCERAAWRRSDVHLPLQVYSSYSDSFRRSTAGPSAAVPQARGPGGKGKGARGGSKPSSICARQLMTPRYRSDSLVALSVAAGKSMPSDHDSRRSAPDVFGSPRWNASPIVCLCRLRHRLLLERGTLPGNVWGGGLSC